MAFTDNYLHALLPTAQLWAWYPLNDIISAGFEDSIKDQSGNDRDLGGLNPSPDVPLSILDALNGYPAITHDGATAPLEYIEAVGLRHIFIVCKSNTGATFDAFRGLISDTSTAAVLLGDSGQSKFFNLTLGIGYNKSQTAHTESAQAAPMTNYELLEISSGGGLALTGLQIGRDRATAGREWKGEWADILCYTTVKANYDLARIRMYYDLKFGLWSLNNTTLVFPNAWIMNIHGTNYYSEYKYLGRDWEAVTLEHTYTDGGKSFNEVNTIAPQRWKLTMTGISAAQADVYDAFKDQARLANTFNFTDKTGKVHTGVQIEDYNRDHRGHLSNHATCTFTLIKYP